jgi:hypothetical protein
MAKLKAHGIELLRIVNERDIAPVSEPNQYADNGYSPTLVYWRRKTRAYMSDGKVLEKEDLKFTPSRISTGFFEQSEVRAGTWKLSGKMRPGKDIRDLVLKLRTKIESGELKHWQVEFFFRGTSN